MSDISTRLPGRTGYDYVGPDAPTVDANDDGTTWWDTSIGRGKVWDGSEWDEESAPDPGPGLDLVGGAYSVLTGDGLDLVGGQVVADLGNGLGIDGNGQVYIPADYATASELSSHATDTDAHHSKPNFAREQGSQTVQAYGERTITISLNNTYDPDTLSASAGGFYSSGSSGGDWAGCAVTGITTDVNGNADGIEITYSSGFDGATIHWNVSGVLA